MTHSIGFTILVQGALLPLCPFSTLSWIVQYVVNFLKSQTLRTEVDVFIYSAKIY